MGTRHIKETKYLKKIPNFNWRTAEEPYIDTEDGCKPQHCPPVAFTRQRISNEIIDAPHVTSRISSRGKPEHSRLLEDMTLQKLVQHALFRNDWRKKKNHNEKKRDNEEEKKKDNDDV